MADGLANNVSFSFPPDGPQAHVGVTFTLAPPDLPSEVTGMLARVLERVPWADRWAISNRVVFVMVPVAGGLYLSPELLKGRSAVAFSETLYLAGSEEFAADILLPQIALVVLQAHHACEPPMQIEVGNWLDPKTGRVTDPQQMQQAAKEYRSAAVDLQIDVHFAQKKAEELAQQWNDAWNATHPRPPVVPAPEPVAKAEPALQPRPVDLMDGFGLGYAIGRAVKTSCVEEIVMRLEQVVSGDATMLRTDAEYRSECACDGEEKTAETIAAARDRRSMERFAASAILTELKN